MGGCQEGLPCVGSIACGFVRGAASPTDARCRAVVRLVPSGWLGGGVWEVVSGKGGLSDPHDFGGFAGELCDFGKVRTVRGEELCKGIRATRGYVAAFFCRFGPENCTGWKALRKSSCTCCEGCR